MGAAPILVDQVSATRSDLTLNLSATRNALSLSLVDGLIDEIDSAARSGVRLLVLRSCVPVFSAGFDLGSLEEETDETLLWRFARIGILLEKLQIAPFTSVALLEGGAVGAGADLALACDHRIGTEAAYFRFPGAGFGVVLGTQRLAMLVGQSRALHLISTNAKLTSSDAHASGVLQVTPSIEDAEADLAVLQAGLDRLPAGTFAQLAQAGRPVDNGKSLADLVRSVASGSGIRDRIAEFAATSNSDRARRSAP